MTSVAARSPTVCGNKRGRGEYTSELSAGPDSDEFGHSSNPQGKRQRALFGIPGGVHVPSLASQSRAATSLQRLLRLFPRMDPQVRPAFPRA